MKHYFALSPEWIERLVNEVQAMHPTHTDWAFVSNAKPTCNGKYIVEVRVYQDYGSRYGRCDKDYITKVFEVDEAMVSIKQ